MSAVSVSSNTQLKEWLSQPTSRQAIASALPPGTNADQFITRMIVAFQREDLINCTAKSKFEAAYQCAVLGLYPHRGHVALIPRNMKDKGLCVTVMPQWQGLQALMLRCENIKSVRATLVHISDTYQYDTETGAIKHQFDPFDAARTINTIDDIRGGYLVVTYHDGTPPLYHYVTAETIRKAQACAAGGNIWQKWFAEMALKTVYRNAYARRVIPMDDPAGEQMHEALDAEDAALENDHGRIIIQNSPPLLKQQTRTEKAANRLKKPAETKPTEDETAPADDETKADDPETAATPEPKRTPSKESLPAAVDGPAKPKSKSVDPFDVQIAKAVTIHELTAIEEAISEAVASGKLNGDEAAFYRSALAKKRQRFEAK